MSLPLIAFDFDGVICDSAAETGESGWRAGRLIWADMPELTEGLIASFSRVRPVLHTGWQSILLMRLLSTGTSPADLLADAGGQQARELMARDGISTDELVAQFGRVRDEWIRDDLDGWLACHSTYAGVIEHLSAFRAAGGSPVVITTKQHRFASQLLERFGVPIPSTDIFGLESGKKADVLEVLLAERKYKQCVFVEDRLETLLEPSICNHLCIRRIFAEWGYCTEEQIRLARSHPHVDSYTLSCFLDLLASYS